MACQELPSMDQELPSIDQELLPGILDDITFAHIVTKLPWKTLRVLSSVSRDWEKAIQTREVYNARVRSLSRETLVVVKQFGSTYPNTTGCDISLYSMSDNAFYQLPRPTVPPSRCRNSGYSHFLSWSSEFISLDGKLYVVDPHCDKKMWVLDLAGQIEWKRCASVDKTVHDYAVNIACGVKMGGENYLRGGDLEWFDSTWRTYDSVQDKWKIVESLTKRSFLENVRGRQFLVESKTYQMRGHEIYIYNSDLRSWAHQHSGSCDGLGRELGQPDDAVTIDPLFILPVNGELLVTAIWDRAESRGICLLQSKGFGTQSKEIVLQKAPHSSYIDDSRFLRVGPLMIGCSFAMCPILL